MKVQKSDSKAFTANLIINAKSEIISLDEISALKKIAKRIGRKKDEIIITIHPEATTKPGQGKFSKWYGMEIGTSISPYRIDLGQAIDNPDVQLPSPFKVLSTWLSEFAKKNPSKIELFKRLIGFSN